MQKVIRGDPYNFSPTPQKCAEFFSKGGGVVKVEVHAVAVGQLGAVTSA